MGTFESFKGKVVEIRDAVERFKDDHKMASKAISVAIDSSPQPFSKFLSIVWDGLEKKDESSTEISSAKLLEIVERIEKNGEQSFSEITEKLAELIQAGATKEDIQELGEKIRTSNELVAEAVVNEVVTRLSLLKCNFRLFTGLTKFSKADKDCWKKVRFTEREVRSGLDARRPVTEDIINSIDKNAGTILYGDSGSGKSMLLKRVMFEEIDNNGYTVVFGDDVKANEAELTSLLEELSKKFNKLLVIADNLQKSASVKGLLKVFNQFCKEKSSYDDVNANNNDSKHIRFLFAARKKQLINVVESDTDTNQEFTDAQTQSYMEKMDILFSNDDAKLFLKKALDVSSPSYLLPTENLEQLAEKLYKNSRYDLLIFMFAVMYYIVEEKITATNFIKLDLDEKKKGLDNNKELWKPALLCSFMGMFGLKFKEKVLKNCNVSEHLPALLDIGFLVDVGSGLTGSTSLWIRHERWAQEFLTLIYIERKSYFEIAYDVPSLIQCMLINNVEINDLLDILYGCTSLYQIEKEHFQPLIEEIVIKNFKKNIDKILNHLKPNERADLYCYGFGNYYDITGKHDIALEYYDKATNENSRHFNAFYNKAIALSKLGEHDEAIRCYNRAIANNSKFVDAYYNKGNVLDVLGQHDKAIECFDKAIKLNRNDPQVWFNKGLAYHKLEKYDDAIRCYDEAINQKSNYADAILNKGLAYHKLEKYDDAIRCYDEALRIQELGVFVVDNDIWYNRACSKVKANDVDSGLKDLQIAIERGGVKYINQATEDRDFDPIRDHKQFKILMSMVKI